MDCLQLNLRNIKTHINKWRQVSTPLVPIFLLEIKHTFKNSFGSLKTPTPEGVPVNITSPGMRVIQLKQKNIN